MDVVGFWWLLMEFLMWMMILCLEVRKLSDQPARVVRVRAEAERPAFARDAGKGVA